VEYKLAIEAIEDSPNLKILDLRRYSSFDGSDIEEELEKIKLARPWILTQKN
jgi:hypothetical protein